MSNAIKYVEPKLELNGSVAVVGSSGRLKHTDYSGVIDNHDTVIRFNRAPTEGYESICGSKTTIRAVNVHVFRNKPFFRGRWKQKNTNFVKDLRNTSILYCGPYMHWKDRFRHCHESNSMYRFVWENIMSMQKEIGYRSRYGLSAGYIIIGIMIASGITPSVFGIDIEQNRHRDHYWEERDNISPCHDISEEKKFLASLRDNGKVNLYT